MVKMHNMVLNKKSHGDKVTKLLESFVQWHEPLLESFGYCVVTQPTREGSNNEIKSLKIDL